MRLPRRQFLHLAAGAAALPVVSRSVPAQTYPSRPVRIIVGFTAGGPGDILARLIGQRLSERLGKPVIIENRPGAASNIGTEVVVRSPPDGHTLLLISSANFINATLYEKLNFNFSRDIAPVASIIHLPNTRFNARLCADAGQAGTEARGLEPFGPPPFNSPVKANGPVVWLLLKKTFWLFFLFADSRSSPLCIACSKKYRRM
jgi:hypothetical protein